MVKLKAIDINDLRVKLDQMNEQIISGLKTRSRFPLNIGTFKQNFADGKTWFSYRLKKEQDIDSEFGRFLYPDQSPIIYSKEELAKPRINRTITSEGIEQVQIDIHKEIINMYHEILEKLCEKKEDIANYGETTKQDVENIILYNERIVGIGEQVAGYKMQNNPELLKLKDPEEIRKKLINPKREQEVIDKMIAITKKYELDHVEEIKKFAQKIINLTTEVEVKRILAAAKNKQ
ncbi:MAG: hypothetical protein WCW13_04355 [archaeon]|jgi:chorismate mutase